MTSIRGAVDTVIGTVLAWITIGLFHSLFWLTLLFVMPFVVVFTFLQSLAPRVFGRPGGVDPEAVEAFDAVWDDFVAGDIAALARHQTDREDFPHGLDPFLQRNWLTNAVHSDSVDSTRWVLEQGVDPNFQDDEGYTPLMSAVDSSLNNTLDLVALLIDKGADPNFRVTLD